MKLLISTMTNFILWDGQTHYLLEGTLEEGKAHYHGITWDDKRLYLSGANNFSYVIYTLDPLTFDILDMMPGDLHEIHQIFYYGNKLYVANTGKNRVEVWQGRQWAHVAFRQSPHDIDHLNGIWSDGEQFYVSEFRHKTSKPSVIRVCDMELGLQRTLEVGNPIHNVYRENNIFYTLVSREPCGIVERLEVNQVTHPLPQLQGMLLRGLARSQDNWFIGASRWETDRDQRHVGDAIIAILDNDFVEVDRIEIKDASPVCDIRLIEPMDLAHNGMEYPG